MSKDKESKIVVPSKVAEFLDNAINKSTKSQLQIAKESGFPKPNMITMIKQGRTKMPITKVILLANSLDIEPKVLLKICFEEYQPGNWQVIEEIFKLK